MKTILSAAVGALLAMSAVNARAQTKAAQRNVELAIEQQSLADALNDWAKQTGLQLVSQSSEMMNSTPAPAVKGSYSPQAALEELLKGTSLTYEWVSDRAVAIRSKPQVLPPLGGAHVDGTSQSVQVARLDQGGEGPLLAHDSEAVAQNFEPRNPARGANGGLRPHAQEVEEVIVTGTHIRKQRNNTVPVTVLDHKFIESTGYTTTAKLMESLPQNFALTTQSGVNVPGTSGSRNQGTAINLRGLGEGTTLVLLNGRRMAPSERSSAVDISAIPIAAIERVEVLTDGASALYGSDAVAGVVNFVLRRDYEGAETLVSSGGARGGVRETRFGQLAGHTWDSGNILGSISYYDRDLLPASARDFVPADSLIGSLSPRDRNYSALVSGQQELSDAVSLFGDALYTKRDSFNLGGDVSFGQDARITNPAVTADLGLRWNVTEDWQLETVGTYSRNKVDYTLDRQSGFPATAESVATVRGAQLKADGALFDSTGGPARLAIGGEWRSESYDELLRALGSNDVSGRIDAEQTVRSAFAQLYIPLFGAPNERAGLRRLEVSLAGRLDDYSTAGSSFDPQLGVMWEPVSGLRLRSSWGTSYKAPNLHDYSLTGNGAAAFVVDNTDGALFPEAPHSVFDIVQLTGTNSDALSPQESESTSVGLEFEPEALPGFELSLNYYRIRYRDQIATPPDAGTVLTNPDAFNDLIVRDPSEALINDFIAAANLGFGLTTFDINFNTPNPDFNPAAVELAVDLRKRNLSIAKTSGLDLAAQYRLDTPAGAVQFGLAGTYILNLEQQLTRQSVAFDSVDTPYNPPKLRSRGFITWNTNGWDAGLFVNHVGSYSDTRIQPHEQVSSYTTVDVRLAYAFSRDGGALTSGLTLAASVQNAFDRDPPRLTVLNPSSDMGFDPTNANPMGRFVSLEIVKAW